MNEFHAVPAEGKGSVHGSRIRRESDWLKQQLRREMYITAFGSGRKPRKLGVETDPLVLKADRVDAEGAGAAGELRKKMVAQRQANGSIPVTLRLAGYSETRAVLFD